MYDLHVNMLKLILIFVLVYGLWYERKCVSSKFATTAAAYFISLIRTQLILNSFDLWVGLNYIKLTLWYPHNTYFPSSLRFGSLYVCIIETHSVCWYYCFHRSANIKYLASKTFMCYCNGKNGRSKNSICVAWLSFIQYVKEDSGFLTLENLIFISSMNIFRLEGVF